MALGDVARHVHPAEEKRHPARTLALEGREPVAGLFEAGTENLRKPVDIVTNFARGAAEVLVRHQQRPGGVIAEADEQQLAVCDAVAGMMA